MLAHPVMWFYVSYKSFQIGHRKCLSPCYLYFWVIIITCGGLQESKLYGAHFKEIGVDSAKATKITFGDSDDE